MGIKTVTVYYNTGFNGTDIPATQSVLSLARHQDYAAFYYMREDLDAPVIRINDNYDNLADVDYVKITNNDTGRISYFFAAPEALAHSTTALHLELDALTTLGGAAAIEYISGWQERGHIKKEEDTPFSNTATEDWRPSQPLVTANFQDVVNTNPQQVGASPVITSTDLKAVDESGESTADVIQGVIEGTGDPVMYFPKIKATPLSTVFEIWDYTDNTLKSYTIPGTGAYEMDGAGVKRALSKLFSAGQLQLQNSYTIPAEWLGDNLLSLETGGYTKLTGWHQDTEQAALPYMYDVTGYTVKNKKCYTTYRHYVLANLGSGDISAKEPAELYTAGSTAPSVRLWSDTTPTGKPYARFSYIAGNPAQYSDAVKGLQWANNQLVMEGAAGSLWNSLNTAFQNATQQRAYIEQGYNFQNGNRERALNAQEAALNYQAQGVQTTGGLIGGIAGAGGAIVSGLMGNIPGAITGAVSAGAGLASSGLALAQMQERQEINNARMENAQRAAERSNELATQRIRQTINENRIGEIKNNAVIAPTVSFSPEQNLGLYGYNRFVIYEIRKTDADLKSEDAYYQRFGYNGLHRPLTTECFNAREYFSYVQAFDVNIKSEFGRRIRMKAISQLNAGVRAWKVLPDASYYDMN